jgi:hypothetical protein
MGAASSFNLQDRSQPITRNPKPHWSSKYTMSWKDRVCRLNRILRKRRFRDSKAPLTPSNSRKSTLRWQDLKLCFSGRNSRIDASPRSSQSSTTSLRKRIVSARKKNWSSIWWRWTLRQLKLTKRKLNWSRSKSGWGWGTVPAPNTLKIWNDSAIWTIKRPGTPITKLCSIDKHWQSAPRRSAQTASLAALTATSKWAKMLCDRKLSRIWRSWLSPIKVSSRAKKVIVRVMELSRWISRPSQLNPRKLPVRPVSLPWSSCKSLMSVWRSRLKWTRIWRSPRSGRSQRVSSVQRVNLEKKSLKQVWLRSHRLALKVSLKRLEELQVNQWRSNLKVIAKRMYK